MQKIVDFSKYSSIKIGPKVRINIVNQICDIPKDWLIIGGCNNTLLPPNPPPIAMLGEEFSFIKKDGDFLHVGAATSGGRVLSFARKNNLKGFEILQKLPGLIGGIVKMNAGLKEWEIGKIVKKVRTKSGWIERDKIGFKYRDSGIDELIFEVVFEAKSGFDEELFKMFKNLRENQPNEPSCGSCFKNPPNDFAGRLLEEAGFRGKRIGNVAFSQKHANFLVNLDGGTYDEAVELIELAKDEVFKRFGVRLEEEILVVEKTMI